MADIHLEKQINEVALQYAELLKDHFQLHSLYVYGSYANGKFTEDSDIDIAVIAEGFSGDIAEDTFQLMKVRRGVDTRIEPHPFLVEDFHENNPLANEVLRSGIRII
jgi:predicted nucleotidyltransferase